ncbi:hypothetical protein Taro_013346 [Colocasia esculenta]|uniref:Uncharacterized protein n=1 Tax=Colocasia esculenta TaxID=4460 RepID=A0A843ULU6_COLES|nr:hypothetical protein [Colocasia esculenta]
MAKGSGKGMGGRWREGWGPVVLYPLSNVIHPTALADRLLKMLGPKFLDPLHDCFFGFPSIVHVSIAFSVSGSSVYDIGHPLSHCWPSLRHPRQPTNSYTGATPPSTSSPSLLWALNPWPMTSSPTKAYDKVEQDRPGSGRSEADRAGLGEPAEPSRAGRICVQGPARYSVKVLRRGTSKVPGQRKANPKSLEMAVTYGPLVVNNHARFGYLATPIVFGDFPVVVGSLYFLGVVPARQEEDAAQKPPSNKSTKKTSRIHANTQARPAAINKGTQMPSKDDVVKGAKPRIRTFSVQTISSQIIAPVSSQRGQNKNHKSKRRPAATSRSGKSIMIGGLRVRIDGSQPVIPRDRYVPTIPTSNRFSALRWFRGEQEVPKKKAGVKQGIRHSPKLKQIRVPKKEAQKLRKMQANTPTTFSKRSNIKQASRQYAEPKRHQGQKRKGIYKKSSYTPQGPDNIQVVKENPTQQLKYRASVSHRILRISVFDRLGAIPYAGTRPSKRRRVTWAAEEKPKLIIFSCYVSGNDSGEPAEQIAGATSNDPTEAIRQFARRNRQPDGQAGASGQVPPRVDSQHEEIQIPFFEETNVQIEEGGPSTSNINPVIDLPTKENFQAMSDDDKYQVMQRCQSQMAMLLHEMRQLITTSLRHPVEPVSTQHQQTKSTSRWGCPGKSSGSFYNWSSSSNYGNGISEEAAAKPISQQAEEFVDDYHQLPSSIVEEAINFTFESQASQGEWVTVGPRKSAKSKRANNSTARDGSNKRSISKSSSEQKTLQKLIDDLEEYIPPRPSDKATLDQYIPWDELERKIRLRSLLYQLQVEALEEGEHYLSARLKSMYGDREITIKELDSMLSSHVCNMVSIPPPKELQTSPSDITIQAEDKPMMLTYQRRPANNRHRKKGRGKEQKTASTTPKKSDVTKSSKVILFHGEESKPLPEAEIRADSNVFDPSDEEEELPNMPMKSFREGVGSFAEPSAIAGRDRIDGDDEDPMVAWVARATTERGEYELDEEADDPEDPPRPNTFLARAIEAAEEEGQHGDVGGGRQPHSSQFRPEEEDEVDLLSDLRMERAMPSAGGANVDDDDVQFERLMLGPTARSQKEGRCSPSPPSSGCLLHRHRRPPPPPPASSPAGLLLLLFFFLFFFFLFFFFFFFFLFSFLFYFFFDSPHNDGEVLQGTINVIGRLSRSMDERIEAMLEMDRFKLKLDIYRDYDVKEAVTRMGPGSHWEQRFAEREALSSQIDVDELFDEEHPLNAWVETRQERDVPEFDPRDCSWAEGELDGVEARDPELRNIREAEEKDKGMDKGDMKDNNIMQPMSGHLGSQTIVQGLLIYLHFSLPFYRTQILVAHLMEYKEDGDLGLHKNKSLVALVKQQVHTNRLGEVMEMGEGTVVMMEMGEGVGVVGYISQRSSILVAIAPKIAIMAAQYSTIEGGSLGKVVVQKIQQWIVIAITL